MDLVLSGIVPITKAYPHFGINCYHTIGLVCIHFGDVETLCRGDVSFQIALAAVYYHGWIVGVHCGVYDTIAFPKDTVDTGSKFYK